MTHSSALGHEFIPGYQASARWVDARSASTDPDTSPHEMASDVHDARFCAPSFAIAFST